MILFDLPRRHRRAALVALLEQARRHRPLGLGRDLGLHLRLRARPPGHYAPEPFLHLEELEELVELADLGDEIEPGCFATSRAFSSRVEPVDDVLRILGADESTPDPSIEMSMRTPGPSAWPRCSASTRSWWTMRWLRSCLSSVSTCELACASRARQLLDHAHGDLGVAADHRLEGARVEHQQVRLFDAPSRSPSAAAC